MNGVNYGGQPIFILPEGTIRETGRAAQKSNIEAAKLVADAVRTTLGPKGMDKMLVDSMGDIVITNDGVTILEEMDVEHPAAKMIVEVAKAQDEEVGDGTTTAAVLAGELLKKAEDLLNQNIHPTIITGGYRSAKRVALETIEKMGKKVSLKDSELLEKIAMTSMTGKSSEAAKEFLAKIAVEAVRQVAEKEDGNIVIDLDQIKFEKKEGGSIEDTTLISGIILDKERVHPNMPTRVENAKILLLDMAIEVKDTETDAQIQITDPSKLHAFIEEEERMLREMVEKIAASGANVVFCQKGIDDTAQHYLAKRGIFAARRLKKSDMEALAKATGGRIVTSLEDISKEDIGEAGVVEEKKISGDAMIFVRKCKDPKAVSILIRGGTEHVVDEIERAMKDAVGCVAAALTQGYILPGGGAPEAEIARELRAYAEKVGGREQLAITAFAEAVEVIPKTLAENAGLDPIDIIVELRARHEAGDKNYGVDVFEGGVADMMKRGVVEPAKVKAQAIKSASEAAEMILRIDDVIAAKKLSREDSKGGETGDLDF